MVDGSGDPLDLPGIDRNHLDYSLEFRAWRGTPSSLNITGLKGVRETERVGVVVEVKSGGSSSSSTETHISTIIKAILLDRVSRGSTRTGLLRRKKLEMELGFRCERLLPVASERKDDPVIVAKSGVDNQSMETRVRALKSNLNCDLSSKTKKCLGHSSWYIQFGTKNTS